MKQTTTIKTIDVNALEWFDKVNGNSYFAGTITVNYGMPDEQRLYMPFQYGYGSQYEHEAGAVLNKAGLLPGYDEYNVFWRYCEDNNIILRHQKIDRCKKRELTAINKLITA